MQNSFEVKPATNDEGQHNCDQSQHDVQVTDDRILHGGFFRQPDDIFSQEGFETVAEEGTRDSAEQR